MAAESQEIHEFMILLRKALLMIVRYIEKRYGVK